MLVFNEKTNQSNDRNPNRMTRTKAVLNCSAAKLVLNKPFSQGRAAQDWTLVSECAGHRCGMLFGGFIWGTSGCLLVAEKTGSE